MKTATFGIGGMHCASCAARNEKTLAKLAGVLKASVNFATHRARIEYDENAVSEAKLHAAVTSGGYQVLAREFGQEHKDRAIAELRSARWGAFAAFFLAAPVAALAVFVI